MAKIELDKTQPIDVITLGRDSTICIAYTRDGESFCMKEVRSPLGMLVDSNPGRAKAFRRQQERDEIKGRQRNTVPYKRKVEHIKSEFHTGVSLFQEGCPIVQIHDLQEVRWPWSWFGVVIGYDLLMEFLPGYDLGDRKFRRSLSRSQKLDYCRQAALALAYMHEQGYVHLDIKPSNIMVSRGRVKLIDFGVTVTTNSQLTTIRGTRGYMAPEQHLKGVVDEKTDIFALGVTFNVIFGGHPLQQGKKTSADQSVNRLGGAGYGQNSLLVPAPEVQELPELERLLRKCTMPQRRDRVPSAVAVADAISKVAHAHGIKLPKGRG